MRHESITGRHVEPKLRMRKIMRRRANIVKYVFVLHCLTQTLQFGVRSYLQKHRVHHVLAQRGSSVSLTVNSSSAVHCG
jgi:hypothetical protein